MPGLHDHQRSNAAAQNPFEEPQTRISAYTAQEIAILQSRLDKQLGPEYISSRPGAGGGKVYYLAAEKVINLANEVFGFNGWSSQIINVQVDFADENVNTGKISLGLSTVVRVTLKDGTFHEDIGYGHIENCKGKAAAFEKAKKEAATDALKRALRTFGNILGNCLYDKDYLQRVSKLKVAPSKWDAENLHRHPDYAPIQKTALMDDHDLKFVPATTHNNADMANVSTEFEDDFGGDAFAEVEMTDVPTDDSIVGQKSSESVATTNASHHAVNGPGAQNNGHLQAPPADQFQRPQAGLGEPYSVTNANHSRGISHPTDATPGRKAPTHHPSHNHPATPQAPRTHEPPVGFVTGRAAEIFTAEEPPPPHIIANTPKFNPKADNNSLHRTGSINYATSAPVKRSSIHGGAVQPAPGIPQQPQVQAQAGNTNNFVNPSENPARRIGMPAAGMSPRVNAGAYKPPGPAQTGAKRTFSDFSGARSPLADVSNVTDAVARMEDVVDGEETKRVRMSNA